MCVKYDLGQVHLLSLSTEKGVICTLTRYGWLVSVGNVQSHLPLSHRTVKSVMCALTRYGSLVSVGKVQSRPRVTQAWESFSRIRCRYVHTPSRAICTCTLCASLLKWLTSDYWQPEAL